METNMSDSQERRKMKEEDEKLELHLHGKKIDVEKMGRQQKKMLVDNLLASDDHLNFLRRIRQRFDK